MYRIEVTRRSWDGLHVKTYSKVTVDIAEMSTASMRFFLRRMLNQLGKRQVIMTVSKGSRVLARWVGGGVK